MNKINLDIKSGPGLLKRMESLDKKSYRTVFTLKEFYKLINNFLNQRMK